MKKFTFWFCECCPISATNWLEIKLGLIIKSTIWDLSNFSCKTTKLLLSGQLSLLDRNLFLLTFRFYILRRPFNRHLMFNLSCKELACHKTQVIWRHILFALLLYLRKWYQLFQHKMQNNIFSTKLKCPTNRRNKMFN